MNTETKQRSSLRFDCESAFRHGREARMVGIPEDQCPYPVFSSAWKEWQKGYANYEIVVYSKLQDMKWNQSYIDFIKDLN